MSTRDNAPPPDGWTPDPHADPFDVWLDALTIAERLAKIAEAAAHCDVPANVILGGAGE